MHGIEQEATNEDHIDMITINSIRSKSKQSVLVANLDTSLSQISTIIPDGIGKYWEYKANQYFQNTISQGNKRTTGGNRKVQASLQNIQQNYNSIISYL